MAKISVLLPVFNEEQHIGACLESVKWADEILVVDSFSTDGTLEIARGYGARIIQHEYINSARQKNWALPQCTHPWVLQIDADEELEVGAECEIKAALSAASEATDAFRLPRRNHFCGRWIRHAGMYPDYQVRLLRRDAVHWADRNVHAHPLVLRQVGTLSHHILHDGAPFLSRQLRNLDRYTRYEADELIKQHRHFSWYRLLCHPWLIFCYRYLWLQGWRDGWRGLLICAYLAVYSFFTYAKLLELKKMGLEKSPQ